MKVKENTVSAFDAKTHLSQLLQEVEKGRTITITRRGKVVARLIPAAEEDAASVDEILTELSAIRKRVKGGYDIKELINEGRKR
ncbi:MAG: type II toxin-antitoxin system prevent-host-death family antitoxin [Syntrophorhabdus sp.]|jgi:prevent-host-death family protein|nr:type II toxin-antitoxin system prevent-host-death family antitoxin [Syntrophorhabdus sp.]